jgi:hypothetical protein
MEILINYWCHLIGIKDHNAIEMAAGIVGGGTALLIVAVVLIWIMDLTEGMLERWLPD